MIGRCLYVDLGWLCPYQIKEKTAEQLSQARLLFMHIARPPVIYSLFATLTSLPGVGPKMEQILAKKTGRHVIDLLRHLPVSVIDRTARPSVNEAEDGQTATFEILVLKADLPPPRTRRPARIPQKHPAARLS